jgi:UDP-4-amino-4,6-dideoxy-N-acetyl-beta-L-altrosamine transaminase
MAGAGNDESTRWRSVPGSVLPYGRQTVTDADVAAVTKVLQSDWLTQGPNVAEFERQVAEHCGAKHAVAVSNGTAALHLAMQSLGLKSGDRLWTSPNTFVASANCGRYCGADVDFVDIDPRTYNLSVDALGEKLEAADKAGTLPTVVVPVHFAGQPCQMSEIGKLADRYGFGVVEDAAHAVGAEYSGSRIGDCAFSSLTTFSFHPVKILTTGEGGMVMTNDDALYERLVCFRTHAITRNEGLLENESHGPWYYEQIELGWNYRITDIQCALGSSQTGRLSNIVEERRAIACRYDELLADLPVIRPWQHPDARSAWHLYVIRIDGDANARREVFDELRAAGIGVQVHYIPVHLQPYYQRLGFRTGDFPVAESYYDSAISLPMFHGLHPEDQQEVVEVLRRILAS